MGDFIEIHNKGIQLDFIWIQDLGVLGFWGFGVFGLPHTYDIYSLSRMMMILNPFRDRIIKEVQHAVVILVRRSSFDQLICPNLYDPVSY